MKIILITLGLVLLIWVISLIIQNRDRKIREKIIKEHLEEKKKEEEAQNQSPFRE